MHQHKQYKIVRMEVNVTVIAPSKKRMTDDEAIDAAMATVTPCMERQMGRQLGAHHNTIAWAKLHAEVADCDCEIIEEGETDEHV